MVVDPEKLARRISEAPFEPETWPSILVDLAELGCGWSATLFGVSDRRYVVDFFGGFSADFSQEHHNMGGGNPIICPRMARLQKAEPMMLSCDADYLSETERDRFAIYRNFYEPLDAHYCTSAVLSREPSATIGIGILHSRKAGAPDAEARSKIGLLLPALHDAAKLQIRLEGRIADQSLKTFERLGLAALICDHQGRITRTTALADLMLEKGIYAKTKNAKLRASHSDTDRQLQSAMDRFRVQSPLDASSETIIFRDKINHSFVPAEITRMPSEHHSFQMDARLLLVFGHANLDAHASVRGLGLSIAEADVAVLMSKGASAQQVADQRGVSVSTVRAQVKNIYQKLNVRRQSELFERLRPLLSR